jgi:hypothetical protein
MIALLEAVLGGSTIGLSVTDVFSAGDGTTMRFIGANSQSKLTHYPTM